MEGQELVRDKSDTMIDWKTACGYMIFSSAAKQQRNRNDSVVRATNTQLGAPRSIHVKIYTRRLWCHEVHLMDQVK